VAEALRTRYVVLRTSCFQGVERFLSAKLACKVLSLVFPWPCPFPSCHLAGYPASVARSARIGLRAVAALVALVVARWEPCVVPADSVPVAEPWLLHAVALAAHPHASRVPAVAPLAAAALAGPRVARADARQAVAALGVLLPAAA